MKSITVFCGSSPGFDSVFEESAFLLGKTLAEQKIDLIYGGAQVGLMGAVANGALSAGGKVIGVLPSFLRTKEIAHEGLTELFIVESMHERKLKMNSLSEGVIALPGGYGTLEEFFEMLTWAQLGLHQKPIAVLNIQDYYTSLLESLASMTEKGFLKQTHLDLILSDSDPAQLLELMRNYKAPGVPKWITASRT